MAGDLVFHHHRGNRQAVVLAVRQQVAGGVERERNIDLRALTLAKVFLGHDKTAADRIISLEMGDFAVAKRGNAHAVFMQGKKLIVKAHAFRHRELNFALAFFNKQTMHDVDIANDVGNGVDINGIR